MAKQDALNIFLSDGGTETKLRETYAEVIDMLQKEAISTRIKNQDLSGDPEAGSVEVSRLMTSSSEDYGTARTAGKGDAVKDNLVTVLLNTDKEIVEEIERKDYLLSPIGDIIGKRARNHIKTLIRELDTAFFAEAVAEGSEVTLTGTDIEDQIEELILEVETTSNDNVDGVDRDMIVLSLKPEKFADLRKHVDTLPNPYEGGVDANYFHGVRVFSNHRQTVDAICMVEGAIAQPVIAQPYAMDRIPLSTALAVELFYSYGTEAVMPDLIQYADLDSASA